MQTGDQESRLFEAFSPATFDQWRKEAEGLIKGAPFEKRLYTHSLEGIVLKPIYIPQDLDGISLVRMLPEGEWSITGEELPKEGKDIVWIRGDVFHDSGADGDQHE